MATDDSHLSLAEFDPPSPLTEVYVPQLTQAEYEEQSATETEKALKELIGQLEQDPSMYAHILRQRQVEAHERGGLLAMLKVRLMRRLKGDEYHNRLVTDDEVQHKLDDLKTGMMMAYNYAQETKGRRYSRRLALKKARERELAVNKENTDKKPGSRSEAISTSMPQCSIAQSQPQLNGAVSRPPPPPPPLPPPRIPLTLTPLKDKNILSSTPLQDPKRRLFRTGSTSSLTSVYSELVSTNPLKRLRATRLPRSPGGTPVSPLCRRPIHGSTKKVEFLNQSESLSSAFFKVMEAKFRNVRSPSPDIADVTVTSPSEFSP